MTTEYFNETECVLGIDPGDMTGMCLLNKYGGEIVTSGQYRADAMPGVLENLFSMYNITMIVYEEFILYAGRAQAQTGSRFFASQVIGMLKYVSYLNGDIPMVVQPAQTLRTAEKLTGLTPPSNHAQSHWIDAYNHAAYYLINRKLMLSQLERELQEATVAPPITPE